MKTGILSGDSTGFIVALASVLILFSSVVDFWSSPDETITFCIVTVLNCGFEVVVLGLVVEEIDSDVDVSKLIVEFSEIRDGCEELTKGDDDVDACDVKVVDKVDWVVEVLDDDPGFIVNSE